jgi:EmrB/QacA subfamily drug resistance transporter
MATQAQDISPAASRERYLDPHHERRWLLLGVLGLAQLMVVLDTTIVNIALPTAQHALAFSNADRQWIVTGYALAFGSLLLLGGRVSDLLGRKRALIAGLVGFAGASAVGGFATNFTMLLSARVFQGAFGALLAPAALSLLTTTFTDAKERSRAFGIYGAIAGAGGALGLLLGGVLTSYASWRWTLFVNVGIAAVAIPGAAVLLVHSRPANREPIDVPGALTVTGGLFALVYGLSHAETTSWTDTWTLSFLAAAVVLLTLFVWLETRVHSPLLPLRVVLDRNRGGALLGVLTSGAGMFGVFLFLTYYLQDTLHYSPIRTGLAFLPMIGVLIVMAQVATLVLLPRFGPKPLVPTGLLVAAGSLMLLTRIGLDSSYDSVILPALLLLGLGFGLIMAPAMNTATLGVQPRDAGVGSAMVNTSQQVGGSIGTALLNTLAASAITGYLVHHGGVHASHVAALATVHGYHIAFQYSALIFVLGAVATALLFRPGAPRPVVEADVDALVSGPDGGAIDEVPSSAVEPEPVPV